MTTYKREDEVTSNMTTIPPHGLINLGASCHFNALLQCLLSCKYIVKHILALEPTNQLEATFKLGIENAIKGRPDVNLSANLLRILARSGGSCAGFDSNQQSSCEGFSYLVDKLKLEWYFEHKHVHLLSCNYCGYIRLTPERDTSIHFEVNEDLYEGGNPPRPPSSNIGVPDDIRDTLNAVLIKHQFKSDGNYKCPGRICSGGTPQIPPSKITNCPSNKHVKSAKDPTILIGEDSQCIGDICGSTDCLHSKKLKMVPEYIVIYLNKYRGKRNIMCPNKLTIPCNEKPMIYKQIAQIEHSGSLNGGHYYACAKRGPFEGGSSPHPPSNNYLFNDNSVSRIGELQTTAGTYMIFYELEENSGTEA